MSKEPRAVMTLDEILSMELTLIRPGLFPYHVYSYIINSHRDALRIPRKELPHVIE